MVETKNFIRMNKLSLENNVSEREAEAKLLSMMFAQNSRIPELKPLTESRPCNAELDCGHACGGCKGEAE